MTYTQVFPVISGIANFGATYFSDLFNVNHWLVIAFFAIFSAYLFYILNKTGVPRVDRVEN